MTIYPVFRFPKGEGRPCLDWCPLDWCDPSGDQAACTRLRPEFLAW